ncbi:hypothetical protein SLS62_006760 [Diatrype stigma]|uniref:Ankyrin repeat protein n=1 Tax=Diatrype stigma TaxID=117547 RepID=A0AAN9YRF6_9PEZI
MEPLELAASIVGIIGFSAKVSLLVYKFAQEVHGVPESLKLFGDTLQRLSDALQQIPGVVKDSKSDSEKQHIGSIERISNDCFKLLQDLERDLPELCESPSRVRRVGAALGAALDMKFNEKAIQEKLDAIQRYTQSLTLSLEVFSFAQGNASETLLAPDEEPDRPRFSRTNSQITERYNETIVAWRESIINVTRDPSIRNSPTTSSPTPFSAEDHILPGRNNSVAAEWDIEALKISEQGVKDLTKKGLYLQASKQQKESIQYRQKLSHSRPFPPEERADMEEIRADLLLNCTTVACLREAASILEGLLQREGFLTSERRNLERQGRLHLKLGHLLTQPERIGRDPDIASAKRHLKQAMTLLGDMESPPDDDLMKAHKLLVPILRSEGNAIEAEAHEKWMLRRRESNVSSSEGHRLSPSISSEGISLAPTTSTSTSASHGFSSGDIGGASKVFEWCERLHLQGCPPDCHEQHCYPYSPQFRFDKPLKDGLSPFHRAIRGGHLEEVKEMAAEVCMADANTSSKLLFLAAESRSAPMARFLVSYGVSMYDCDSATGMTALHYCQVGDRHRGVTISEYILDVYPDCLNTQDKQGRTALFLAVENSHRRMAQMLLRRGANPNIHDNYSRTCLHLAVEAYASEKPHNTRSQAMVKGLLDHRADPNVRDNTDKTPLYLAADLGNVQIVDYLLHAGADVNGRGVLNETPLIAAIKHHHLPVVKKLVASGADPTLRDKHNNDAFYYATGSRRRELLRALPGRHTSFI